MRDIAMSECETRGRPRRRVDVVRRVGRGGAAPWAARGQPSWGARAGGAAAGRFGPFAHSGRSRSRARSSSAKQRVLGCCARPRWPRVRSPTRGGTPAEADPRVFGFWAFRISGRIPISRGLIFTSRTFLHSSSLLFGRLALSPCPVRWDLDAPRFCDGLRLQAALVELDFQAPPLPKRSISVVVRLAGMANERERERSDDRLLTQST